MGRRKTGAILTSEARKLELSYLLKQGLIKKNAISESVVYWCLKDNPIGSMKILTYHSSDEKWIRLIYTVTDNYGKDTQYDYKIELIEVDSNLGKGKILFMVCPESGKRCKILYLAYGTSKFKSREAYQNRLYFSTQKCSKLDFWNTKYFELEKRIEELGKLRTCTYRGKATKKALRLNKLMAEKDFCNIQRWSEEAMTKAMRKTIGAWKYDFLQKNQKS